MLRDGYRIYLATRKKNDQLWNQWVMRPLAGYVVALFAPTRVTPNQLTLASLVVFVVGSALVALLPERSGALAGVAVLELSYLFDCADGMLARHRKTASKEGHLFDFFTDESKALLLVIALALRGYLHGGLGPSFGTSPFGASSGGSLAALAPSLERLPAREPTFLLAGLFVVAVVASATSLTNFVRRPELSGRETPVDAHYETVAREAPKSPARWLAGQLVTFLRFLNHYPSHLWLFALAGGLDVFFWLYGALTLLYLAKGWLGLTLRFGRFEPRA